jgi:hypothetical protein
MDLVKNLRLKVAVMKVVDMNVVKNDAINVKYLSNGKDFGVHVVDIC